MNSDLRDGRLSLNRTKEDRDPLLQRLSRVEGQVRGLRQMIEADRTCGDELQQATAILSALRELMHTLVDHHIAADLDHFALHPATRNDIMSDIAAVLRPLLHDQ